MGDETDKAIQPGRGERIEGKGRLLPRASRRKPLTPLPGLKLIAMLVPTFYDVGYRLSPLWGWDRDGLT